MPPALSRRHLLGWMMAGVFLAAAVMLVSLASWITGVYSCPLATMMDGSNGYLVHKEGRWFAVSINGSGGPHCQPANLELVKVTSGIWNVEITFHDTGESFWARSSFDLVDIYQIAFGRYRGICSVP